MRAWVIQPMWPRMCHEHTGSVPGCQSGARPKWRSVDDRYCPSPRLKRWVAARKAEVLAAVDCGLLAVDEACARYGISLDEFLSWKRAVGRAGLRGLSVKRVQDHRPRRVEQTRKCW